LLKKEERRILEKKDETPWIAPSAKAHRKKRRSVPGIHIREKGRGPFG